MVVTKNELIYIARTAVDEANDGASTTNESAKVDPNSNDNTANQRSILIAKKFVSAACPGFLQSSISKDDDRLVKVGRAIEDMLQASLTDNDENTKMSNLEASLGLLVEECTALASGSVKVPKVRFGKTNLQMPIVTLGCMRFQQSWNFGPDPILNLDQVSDKCQENLKNILRYAIKELGINHIETARMYGCSELQLGDALKSLFDEGEIKREDLIIQTKVAAFPNADQFRKLLEESFEKLQVDYVDLFSFHGMNMNTHYDMVFNNGENGNCYDVVEEYVKAGKIRNVGFSSHGATDVIQRLIETDKFDYANLHYHYYGSYTATGGGECGGNLDNIKLMNEKDMGVFIISAYDKGGRLYAPSRKLRSLTLPDLEPIAHGSLWLWNHHELVSNDAKIHTIVCGAARPSDLDQPALAAYFHQKRKDEMLEKTRNVSNRLHQAALAELGEDWMKTWHIGLPNCSSYDGGAIQFGQIVGLYNVLKAYGLHGYCKDRYATFEGNSQKWDENISIEENIDKLMGWGWMPGIEANEESNDYAKELSNVPDQNKAKVLETLNFVKKYCKKDSDPNIPKDWETAYDMRPWNAFPERA